MQAYWTEVKSIFNRTSKDLVDIQKFYFEPESSDCRSQIVTDEKDGVFREKRRLFLVAEHRGRIVGTCAVMEWPGLNLIRCTRHSDCCLCVHLAAAAAAVVVVVAVVVVAAAAAVFVVLVLAPVVVVAVVVVVVMLLLLLWLLWLQLLRLLLFIIVCIVVVVVLLLLLFLVLPLLLLLFSLLIRLRC